jgi:hypothetical protein
MLVASGVQKGQVSLAVLTGATYFSNLEIRNCPASERLIASLSLSCRLGL